MNLFLWSLWKKKMFSSFGTGFSVFGMKDRGMGSFLNQKSWHSMQKKPYVMRQGVCVLRTAFNPIWLGHNGSEEQWEIMLKMQYGRGVESCTWQAKETTVLVQIRTGLWRDQSDNEVENELGERTEEKGMLNGRHVKPSEGLN